MTSFRDTTVTIRRKFCVPPTGIEPVTFYSLGGSDNDELPGGQFLSRLYGGLRIRFCVMVLASQFQFLRQQYYSWLQIRRFNPVVTSSFRSRASCILRMRSLVPALTSRVQFVTRTCVLPDRPVSVWFPSDTRPTRHNFLLTAIVLPWSPAPSAQVIRHFACSSQGLTFMCQSIRCANRAVCHFPRYSICRCSVMLLLFIILCIYMINTFIHTTTKQTTITVSPKTIFYFKIIRRPHCLNTRINLCWRTKTTSFLGFHSNIVKVLNFIKFVTYVSKLSAYFFL